MSKIIKKLFTVMMAMVVMCLTVQANWSIFATSPLTANNKTEVASSNMVTSEKVTIDSANGGTVSPMADAGPVFENPGIIVANDGKTVTGGYGVFYLDIPAGTTVNTVYLLGKNTSGYSTTCGVIGLGSLSYRADLNGEWYRVSNKGMNYYGPLKLAIHVQLVDTYHPYNIMLVGCK